MPGRGVRSAGARRDAGAAPAGPSSGTVGLRKCIHNSRSWPEVGLGAFEFLEVMGRAASAQLEHPRAALLSAPGEGMGL